MIQYYDWLPQLESIEGVCSISNKLLVFSYSDIKTYIHNVNPFHAEAIGKPHKFDFFLIILHKAGGAKIKVDMEEYELSNPKNIMKIIPGQIISLENLTPDFDADYVIILRPSAYSVEHPALGAFPERYLSSFAVDDQGR